jgi:acetyltransferase-like isoleucine patch superfamily enzyme
MTFRLGKIKWLRRILIHSKRAFYIRVFKMDLHPTCEFSLSAKFDMTNPKGIHIGEESYVAFGAVLLSHDMTRGVRRHTRVGKRCFIGANSIILPGITIGDHSIVGAGAVVVRDVPAHSIVAGNPARVIRSGIETGRFGRLDTADDVERHETRVNAFAD